MLLCFEEKTMNLEIENFGKIKKAGINLEGLTVITGENDTGKSTVGKILFWLVNTINGYSSRSEEIIKNIAIKNISNSLTYIARKGITIPKNLDSFTDNSLFTASNSLKFEDIKNMLSDTLNFIKNADFTNDTVIKKYYDDMKNIEDYTEEDKLFLSLEINKSEIFEDNINNSVDKNSVAKIRLSLNGEDIFSAEVEKDIFKSIKFNKDKFKILWNNVDFIETPLMIDNINENSNKIWENKFLKEYKEKIVASKQKNGFDAIKNLLNANVVIDDKTGKILFKKNEVSKELDILNIATGAKSFVVLDILRKLGNFETNSITVFDEPENHLHPAWQIKYAELLVSFVKNGANIVLTTHSPYMVQALKYYIDKEKLNKDRFRFLLSEKLENNWANLNDVTDKSYKIFDVLEKPLFDVTPEE